MGVVQLLAPKRVPVFMFVLAYMHLQQKKTATTSWATTIYKTVSVTS